MPHGSPITGGILELIQSDVSLLKEFITANMSVSVYTWLLFTGYRFSVYFSAGANLTNHITICDTQGTVISIAQLKIIGQVIFLCVQLVKQIILCRSAELVKPELILPSGVIYGKLQILFTLKIEMNDAFQFGTMVL